MRAPGNYSDQFWSNKRSISLCEGPKPQNSMISGYFGMIKTPIKTQIALKNQEKTKTHRIALRILGATKSRCWATLEILCAFQKFALSLTLGRDRQALCSHGIPKNLLGTYFVLGNY